MEDNGRLPSVNLLGVSVHRLTAAGIVKIISRSVLNGERRIIANHNLHSIYIYHHNREMRSFYDIADYVFIDGMSLVLAGRLAGHPLGRDDRLTSLDWMVPVLSSAERQGWRIFYLGSRPGIAEKGAGILRSRHPGLNICASHGYFDAMPWSEDNQRTIERINAYRPHILMAGMGMPRQELWLLHNCRKLNANVILSMGAYMDYIAGAVPTPPRWMGKAGLEWLYRLLSEPRRLWRRYLLEPWFIARMLLRESARPPEHKKT